MIARDIDTPAGTARAHLTPAGPGTEPVGTLVLGHGAGGGIGAPDLAALTGLAGDGWQVLLVEQPWRVAGRRVAPPPSTLDAAWIPVLAALEAAGDLVGPLVVGGRSAGARVACRTATSLLRRPAGVLGLAFPLHPPGRPGVTRAEEARAVLAAGLPLGIVQGARDPFGTPEQVATEVGPGADVMATQGDHSLRRRGEVLDLVRGWLTSQVRD